MATVKSIPADSAAIVALALLTLAAPGCAGTALGRQGAAQRVPTDGVSSGPSPAALELQKIVPGEWTGARAASMAPACDARAGAQIDAAKLDEARKAISAWADRRKKVPRPSNNGGGVNVSQLAGIHPEPTRRVDAAAIECAPGKAALVVNGTSHPFDMAWVVVNVDKFLGTAVSIQALSLADKKMGFLRLQVPVDAKAEPDETFTSANLGAYLPANGDDPIVRNMHRSEPPLLETLLFAKGSIEGFYVLVPRSKDLGLERYFEVGRFHVAE